MDDMQPGQVISPRGELPDPVPPASPSNPQVPVAPVAVPASSPAPAQATIPYTPENQTTPTWQPQPDTAPPAQSQPVVSSDRLEWIGAEFIAHDKTSGWYAILSAAGLIGAVLVYFLTKDKLTAGIIALAVIAFAVFAARKPREQQYALTNDGLQVGGRYYSFHDFKSFSIADEGGVSSVVFMPMKRFMPPLTIYVPAEKEPVVAEFVAQLLPFEPHKADAVDALLHRIRF